MYPRIFICLLIFIKAFVFTSCCDQSNDILQLQDQVNENRKLLLQLKESLLSLTFGTNDRIFNTIENAFKEFKDQLEDHIKTTSADNDVIIQDITYLKLRLNEFKIGSIENSLESLHREHHSQDGTLNEIKHLIDDNRSTVSNETSILQEELKEQHISIKDVARMVERVKILATNEIPNCDEVIGYASGVYNIYLPNAGLERFKAYCLSDNQHGSTWTIIQRRQDNSTNFFRGWDDYKQGFGEPSGNYWIGLEKLHALTSQQPYELWIQLEDFEGNKRTANYSAFAIGNEQSQYTMTVLGDFKGDAGDSLRGHDGQKFSTFDADNDIVDGNCAANAKGAWWYKNCHNSNLNGEYIYGKHDERGLGIIWYHWLGNQYSLKYVHMAIRPQMKK